MKKVLSIFVLMMVFTATYAQSKLTLDELKIRKTKSELLKKCSKTKADLQKVDATGKSYDLFLNRPAVKAALQEVGLENKTSQLMSANSEEAIASIIAASKTVKDVAPEEEKEKENVEPNDEDVAETMGDNTEEEAAEEVGESQDVTTEVINNTAEEDVEEEIIDEDNPANDKRSGGVGLLGVIITSIIVSLIVSIVIVLLYNNTHKQMHYNEENTTAKQQQQITMLSNRISQLENQRQ